MPFRSLLSLFWKVALAIFVIELLRWWFVGSPIWSAAVTMTLWTALILLIVWGMPNPHKVELEELERRRVLLSEYRRWLAVYPDIDTVLHNMDAAARGEQLDVGWPARPEGPWEVSRLREVIASMKGLAQ